jgi:Spy/CpxP family protein refolding chaperone
MEQPAVDSSEAERRIDDVEQARAKLEKARAMMFLEIRQVLTPEQRSRARELLARRRERRGARLRLR